MLTTARIKKGQGFHFMVAILTFWTLPLCTPLLVVLFQGCWCTSKLVYLLRLKRIAADRKVIQTPRRECLLEKHQFSPRNCSKVQIHSKCLRKLNRVHKQVAETGVMSWKASFLQQGLQANLFADSWLPLTHASPSA